ncbi:DMT family transporter [Phenylobacterium sp. 58.2.17]|uniref:DMT family transporter n=1 Tax=Phenylobacterium sp. 58.2.17 TaxID=2969306 RepID=UPI00226520A7|nr:DMT family transporter [Phenylobacterium sp. 58.2.17]MCX7584788.1 DMT family transporter [Phenylobacterium sp. 58.2.17]
MDDKTRGWIDGLLGVAIFSGSLPATRVAVAEIDPLFLTAARAVIAGVLALGLLSVMRAPRPARRDLAALALVAAGVVAGFPLLTAIALREITAAHSIVFIGLLPMATALFAVVRAGEHPSRSFWAFAGLGAALVAVFALTRGAEGSLSGDLLMVAAVAVCGLGYAEGGRLSRTLGGWQVICWALVIALPAMAALGLATWPTDLAQVSARGWTGLAYVSLFSMLIGFVFWYRGLALGGVAAVGQLQLLQPLMGLGLAAWLLGEPVGWSMAAVTAGVVLCVAGAKRFA